jgi:hypothetical protein
MSVAHLTQRLSHVLPISNVEVSRGVMLLLGPFDSRMSPDLSRGMG